MDCHALLQKHLFLFDYIFIIYACVLKADGDSPGKNTGVGCHSLAQVIFPTQGLNPGLLHFRQILYCLGIWEAQELLVLFSGKLQPCLLYLPNISPCLSILFVKILWKGLALYSSEQLNLIFISSLRLHVY